MQIFQLVGIAIITAVAALLLKGTKPELAFAVTIAGGIILLRLGTPKEAPVLEYTPSLPSSGKPVV